MTAQDVAGVIAELLKLIAVCEKAASDERRVLLDPAAVLPIAKSAHSSLESQAKALSEACEVTEELRVDLAIAECLAVEANDRALAAESRLAEARRVIEPIVSRLEWDGHMQRWALKPDMPAGSISAARDFLNAAKEKT